MLNKLDVLKWKIPAAFHSDTCHSRYKHIISSSRLNLNATSKVGNVVFYWILETHKIASAASKVISDRI